MKKNYISPQTTVYKRLGEDTEFLLGKDIRGCSPFETYTLKMHADERPEGDTFVEEPQTGGFGNDNGPWETLW